jgi:hypothetical protein
MNLIQYLYLYLFIIINVIVYIYIKDIQNTIFESFDCKSIRLINYTNNNIFIYIYIYI